MMILIKNELYCSIYAARLKKKSPGALLAKLALRGSFRIGLQQKRQHDVGHNVREAQKKTTTVHQKSDAGERSTSAHPNHTHHAAHACKELQVGRHGTLNHVEGNVMDTLPKTCEAHM